MTTIAPAPLSVRSNPHDDLLLLCLMASHGEGNPRIIASALERLEEVGLIRKVSDTHSDQTSDECLNLEFA